MAHLIWVEWEDINQLADCSLQFAKNTVPLAAVQEGFFIREKVQISQIMLSVIHIYLYQTKNYRYEWISVLFKSP